MVNIANSYGNEEEEEWRYPSFIIYIIQFNLSTARTKNYYFPVLSGEVGGGDPKLQIIYPNVHSWEEEEPDSQKTDLKACGFYVTLGSVLWSSYL